MTLSEFRNRYKSSPSVIASDHELIEGVRGNPFRLSLRAEGEAIQNFCVYGYGLLRRLTPRNDDALWIAEPVPSPSTALRINSAKDRLTPRNDFFNGFSAKKRYAPSGGKPIYAPPRLMNPSARTA